ncbi:MAG: V-type ATP synthase subunit I [Candidatus Muiribacteriaceae bacterium]
MSVSKVRKYGIVVTKKNKERLIRLLHTFQDVQIIEPDNNDILKSEDNRNMADMISDLQSAISTLTGYEKKKGLKALLAPRKEIRINDFKEEVDEQEKNAISKINKLKEELKDNSSKSNTLRQEIDRFSEWEDMNISLDSAQKLTFSHLYFIRGKSDCFRSLKKKLDEKGIVSALKSQEYGSEERGVVIFLENSIETVFKIIMECGISIEEFNVSETASEKVKTLKEKLEKIEKRDAEIHNEIRELSEVNDKLKELSDFLLLKQEEIIASGFAAETRYSAYIKVWVPEKRLNALKKMLTSDIKEIEIMEVALDENETPPVLLRGNTFTSPFQSITSMYGTPGKDEFDPTPLFAVFFVIFFGFCLSDAGYGLVILLATLMSLFIKDIDRDLRQGIRLMMYCGISTIIMGALAGGWFGLPLQDMDNGVAEWLLSFKVVDPNEDALILMGASLFLGVVQILWSKLIAAYKEFRLGNYFDSCYEVLWFVYLGVFFPAVVKYIGYIDGADWLYSVFLYLMLAIVLFNMIRSDVHILLRPIMSALKIYDTVAYFGDVLSYSRLMALGMATGGVALAINMIADLAADMLPVIGVGVQIFILIFGHAFNIIMNVLGSFIHSMRLQFVEFFQKFFEGGGKVFRPFSMKTKHIRLINE